MGEKQKIYSIYKITCIKNNKIYIGKTEMNPPEKRWKAHIQQLKYPKRCHYLHNAIIAHGVDNFTFEVIAQCNNSENLKQLEIDLIADFKSNDRNLGYNLTKGGDGSPGYKHTDKSKKIMSEIKKINYIEKGNPFYKKTHTEETKKIIGELASKRYIGENNPFFGKTHSEETIQKLRENHYDKEKFFSDEECSKIRSEYVFRKNTFKMLAKNITFVVQQ